MRAILFALAVLIVLPAAASSRPAAPGAELPFGSASALPEAGAGFSLGVRDREARMDSGASSSENPSQGDVPGVHGFARSPALGSVRPNYGAVGAWWKNSSTTTRVWSIVGTVLVVGITAASL